MWSAFYQILRLGAKYGSRFATWCWNNRARIFDWLSRGFTVGQIVEMIARLLGLA